MNKKSILLAIVILFVLLLICIICWILLSARESNQNSVPYEEENPVVIKVDNKLKKVSNRNNYYAVESAVNKFYTYYMNPNEEQDYKIIDEEVKESIEKEKKENAEILYNMLDAKYIEFKEITKDNLLTKLPQLNSSIIDITNMYVSEQTTDIYLYIVQGTLREKQSNKISNFLIMIKLDTSNKTFTVFLEDYIKENYGTLKLDQPITLQPIEHIEKNINNAYDYRSISEETYIVDMFNKYKDEILYNRSLAYQHLEENYKNKKFKTQEDFETYVKNNIKNNVTMELKQYKIEKIDNETQYLCIDQNEKEYIFKETAVMEYSVILDTYTLDLPEFLEKYEGATEKEKIELNMQKIVEAINDKDYHYVYSKLDQTFKDSYYPTEKSLETYINQNLYSKNEVQLLETEKSEEIYVSNIRIQNAEDENSKNINMRVIMSLKEGTDFVISFSEI